MEVYEDYKELTRGTPVDVTGLSHERLRRGPVQWTAPDILSREERPRTRAQRCEPREEHPGTHRLYTNNKLSTASGRARFEPTFHEILRVPPGGEYPLTLSNGRVKNQWHAMTRTGRAKKLMKGLDDPFVEVHLEAAGEADLKDGEQARIVSARGSFETRVVVTEGIEPGTVFVPFYWGDMWTGGGSLEDTTHDASCPVSHQLELKGAAVRLEPVGRLENKEGKLSTTANE